MVEKYYKLHFSKVGYPLDATEQDAILKALIDTVKPVTDLWIFSHGWNTDAKGAHDTYDTWVGRMQERIEREIVDSPDAPYNPLFVGIYWPSIALSNDASSDTTPPSPFAERRIEDPYTLELKAYGIEPSGTSGEIEESGGEVQLEMSGQEASSPSYEANELGGKADFIEDYHAFISPNDDQVGQFERDFDYLYDVLLQSSSPTPDQIEKFVRILRRYKVDDPQHESFEEVHILNELESAEAQLKEEVAMHTAMHEGFRAEQNPLLSLLRASTFWSMKGRAAVVGEYGVACFLRNVKQTAQQHNHSIRIHLFGHSFGAKLVSSAVYALSQLLDEEGPLVNTLVLLLGAFSQFSFSSNVPFKAGVSGRYASLIVRKLVANPIVVIYSQYDLANKEMYPFGMRFAQRSKLYEWGSAEDRFGAIGANGAQALDTAHCSTLEMLSLDEPYALSEIPNVVCLNIDGQNYINDQKGKRPIGSHGDTGRPEIFHAALAVSRHK